MIWTILLVLLITVVSLLVIAGSLILFPVFTFGIYAVLRPENKKIEITGSWLHPRIVTFTLNPFNKNFALTFLGRRLFGSSTSRPSSEKSESVPETESSSAHPEPNAQKVPDNDSETDEFEVVSSRPEPEIRKNSEIYSDTLSEGKTAETEDKAEVETRAKTKAATKIADKVVSESETVKDGFFSRLKKNRYFYMIRQRKLQTKLLRWIMRIFKSLFRIIRFDHFDTSIKAGIEEPALLGNVYAFYTMTRYTVNVSKGEPILKFEPVFMKNWFEGEGRFSLKTSIITLIWPVLIAAISFPFITVLWLFWKSRKIKSKN
jgi:hypothetical protein